MSFQKDVTQTMIPGPAQEPLSRGGKELASALAFVGDQFVKTQKKDRDNEISSYAQQVVDTYLAKKEQYKGDPMGESKAGMEARQAFASFDGSATEKQKIRDIFAHSVGGSAAQFVSRDIDQRKSEQKRQEQNREAKIKSTAMSLSGDSQIRAALFNSHPELVNKVTTQEATVEEEQELIRVANNLFAEQQKAKVHMDNANAFVEKNAYLAGQEYFKHTDTQAASLSKAISGLRYTASTLAQDPNVDEAEAWLKAQQQLVNTAREMKDNHEQGWSELLARAPKEGRAELEDWVKVYRERTDAMIKGFEELDTEEFKTTTQALEYFESELKLNALKAAPALFRFQKEVGTAGYNAIMQQLIAGDTELRENLKTKVRAGLDDAETASARKLDNLLRVMTDKSLLDLSVDEQDELFGTAYTTFKQQIKTGNAHLASGNAKNTMAHNMAIMLDLAKESGDVAQQERALDLLNEENYDTWVKGLDEDQKKVINNLTLQFNMDVVRDTNKGVAAKLKESKGVKYDAAKGEFVIDKQAYEVVRPRPQPSLLATLAGGGQRPEVSRTILTGFKEDEKLVKKANSYLNKIVKMKSEDGFLSSLSDKEVKDWVLFTSNNKPEVIGKIKDFPEEFLSAAKQQVSVQELEVIQKEEQESRGAMEALQQQIQELQTQVTTGKDESREVASILDAILNATDPVERDALINELRKVRGQ